MGDCVSSVYAKIGSPKELKFVLIGLDLSGKTTLLYKLKLDENVTTIPTIGFNVESLSSKEGFDTKFCIWDLGGTNVLRCLWKHYYNNVDGLIFVIDGNDRNRIEEAYESLTSAYKECQDMVKDQLSTVPCLILMNKMELPQHMKSSEFFEKYELYDFFDHEKWFICDICAFTYEGVKESFTLLLDCIKGFPKPQIYHLKGMGIVKRIQTNVGWRPELHNLFPKSYQQKVWSLILMTDRLGMSVDSMKIILSFLEVKFLDHKEMKVICTYFERHRHVLENVPKVKENM